MAMGAATMAAMSAVVVRATAAALARAAAATSLGRARTRARPCAPPRPVLHSSLRGVTDPSSPHAAATWQAARADAWEKQKLGSKA